MAVREAAPVGKKPAGSSFLHLQVEMVEQQVVHFLLFEQQGHSVERIDIRHADDLQKKVCILKRNNKKNLLRKFTIFFKSIMKKSTKKHEHIHKKTDYKSDKMKTRYIYYFKDKCFVDKVRS